MRDPSRGAMGIFQDSRGARAVAVSSDLASGGLCGITGRTEWCVNEEFDEDNVENNVWPQSSELPALFAPGQSFNGLTIVKSKRRILDPCLEAPQCVLEHTA